MMRLWRIRTNYGKYFVTATESQVKAKHDEYIRKWLEMIECEKKDGRNPFYCHRLCEATFSYTPVQHVLLGAIKLPLYQAMPTGYPHPNTES